MASAESLASGGSGKGTASSANKILYRAVVTDVFSNPAQLISTQINTFKQTPGKIVANLRDFDKMPRNSISAILIGEGEGQLDNTPRVFFPLFSPHLGMPIKPGEQVIVIFSEANAKGRGFWVTRVSTDIDVDDLNYTHGDRVQPQTPSSGLVDIASGIPAGPPSFPNGGGQPSNLRLPGLLAYENIVTKSYALRLGVNLPELWTPDIGMSAPIGSAEFTGEPVPRFSKKASDTVLQGSNNTLISLGEDWTFPSTPAGLATWSVLTGRGAIDIVTGRGQGLLSALTTGPQAILNTRGYQETDKTSLLTKATEGDQSGDDLSRVYVTMAGACDQVLAPGMSLPPATWVGSDLATPAPYAVMKSEHVRLIANATGTIKIICGGTEAATPVASGLSLDLTSAQLVGPTAYIGPPIPDTSVAMPLVYGTPLAAFLTSFTGALSVLSTSLAAVTPAPAATPDAGEPGLVATIAALNTFLTTMSTAWSTAAPGGVPAFLSPTTKCM